MQYLMNVIHDSRGPASDDEMAAIGVFNDGMRRDGYLVFAGGLRFPDSSSATVFDNRASAGLVTDGPFVESKEFVVGFWIIDVPSLSVARQLAAEGSKACNRKVELRPFLAPPQ
jgi:hypothetical protein